MNSTFFVWSRISTLDSDSNLAQAAQELRLIKTVGFYKAKLWLGLWFRNQCYHGHFIHTQNCFREIKKKPNNHKTSAFFKSIQQKILRKSWLCSESPFFSTLLFISLSQSTSALQLIPHYFLPLKIHPSPLCGIPSSAVTSDHSGSDHLEGSKVLLHFFSHDTFHLFLSRL